jgi:hypothetical protein
MPHWVLQYLRFALFALCAALVGWLVYKLAATQSKLPAGGVPSLLIRSNGR